MTRRTTVRTALTTAIVLALGALAPSAALAAGKGQPAAGAPIGDVIWGGIVGLLTAGCVLAVGVAHRQGRIRWLSAVGDFSARVSGFPAWYALPAAIAGISLLVAVTGFYWDVATHIDNGRDPGPFGNAAHFPILIGLGGIALAGIVAVLLGADQRDAVAVRLRSGWRVPLGGLLVLGLSTLQREVDYGVPQFQMVFHPILLMLAAGVGLVAARVYVGRGGALAAVGFFIGLRGLITLLVGPVLGLSTLHFPLYLAEAGLVELAALRLGTERPVRLGVVSGVLIGTVGLAAEWGWSHVWMPLPWPGSLLPEAAPLGLAAALAGGILGAFVGGALATGARPSVRLPLRPAWLAAAAGAVAILCLGFPLPMNAGPPTTANVTLRDVSPSPHRQVQAAVRLSPRGAADHAQWLSATAWQGGGLVVDRLRKVGAGRYVTTEPIPVWGKWKAMLRLENGRGVRAV